LKSRVGMDLKETPRELAFCNCAIQGDDILLIEDTQHDKKFSTHPYVTDDPHIRFYAGVPLKTHYNQRIGTLCLIDTKPGILAPHQIESLELLAKQVVELLELRRANL